MKKLDTRVLVEVSISVALSLILGMLRLYKMPQGGSISLEVLPILIMAMKYGGPIGILTGTMVGLLQLLIGPYIIHPMQVIMDYPLPFAMVGFAGYLRKKPILGACIGITGRFIIHVLSGVIFFASYAPEGISPWRYSIVYNASYLIPEMIICAIVLSILMRKGGNIVGDRD
jgi:thiamine transporter